LFVVGNDGGIYSTWWNPTDGWDRNHNWFRIGRGDQNVPEGNTVTAVARQPAEAAGAPDFTDWLEVDAERNVAKGTLHRVPVSLSGSDVGAASVTDRTFTGFAEPFFSPTVSTSDALEIRGLPGYSYALTFGSPVRDPVLHFASLASKVAFSPGTVVSKVAGQNTFTVSDSSVTGAVGPSGQTGDANGTVRLSGEFDFLSFSVTPVFVAAQGDGIWVQVGAAAAAPPPPPPAPARATDLFVVGHNGGIYGTWGQEGQPWANWSRIGYNEFVVVHFKSLLPLTPAINTFINTQFTALEQLLAGFEIRVFRATTEGLSGNPALAHLVSLDVGDCDGSPTEEQEDLFANRNDAGPDDLVVYIVQTLQGGAGNFVGCATHPDDQPGAAIVQNAANWLLAHEIGHVLDLDHVDTTPATNADFLMWPNTAWTNVPPDLTADEVETILDSDFTRACSPNRSGW
jgi:hypothetical protein